jgi:hypothetical protein
MVGEIVRQLVVVGQVRYKLAAAGYARYLIQAASTLPKEERLASTSDPCKEPGDQGDDRYMRTVGNLR